MENNKIFVIDTSVIIHDPHAILQFGEHDIVIPLAVISELDGFKNGNDQKAFNARDFSRFLDSLKEAYQTLLEMVPLPEPATGRICVSTAGHALKEMPVEIDDRSKDRQIIATALRWMREKPARQVVLVSKDTNVRLLGHACGLATEDYKRGQVRDYTRLFDDPLVLTVDDSFIDRLMKEHTLPVAGLDFLKEHIKPNNCITFTGNIETNKSALAVVDTAGSQIVIRRLLRDEARIWGLYPRNREQIFAAALLLNSNVRLVSLIGKAGTGKTLLALAAGLEQTFEVPARRYKKIVVMRPVVPVGKDLGWLPGDVHEKIAPWMRPIYDNISFILGEDNPKSGDVRHSNGNTNRMQALFEHGISEIEVMSYVRGRSINDAFIIIDEAQNLTLHEIKTVITRAAGTSKVVLTGDLGQIDTPYLDAHSSGLSHVIKKFSDQPIAGYVSMVKGERSELAELAADLL